MSEVTKTRQSNIELLRIVSMLMIVIFHFNGHALQAGEAFSAQWFAYNLTHTLTITATSIFVLISGYFGIHVKVKGVLRLYLQCFIWGLVGYLLYCYLCDVPVGPSILGRFMPFTHNKMWFIESYLALYFMSPILNAAIANMDKRKHLSSILIFGIVTLYMGYCRETGEDTWGTSATHFMWLYMIARYINKYVSPSAIREHRWTWLFLFLIMSLITFCLELLNTKIAGLPVCLRAYPYCSPWTLLGAIGLLLFALSFSFDSKVVNCTASSVLSSYLLQDNIYFGMNWLYPTIGAWMMSLPLLTRYSLIVPLSLLFMAIVIAGDKLCDLVLYRPIIKWYIFLVGVRCH